MKIGYKVVREIGGELYSALAVILGSDIILCVESWYKYRADLIAMSDYRGHLRKYVAGCTVSFKPCAPGAVFKSLSRAEGFAYSIPGPYLGSLRVYQCEYLPLLDKELQYFNTLVNPEAIPVGTDFATQIILGKKIGG